MIGTNSFGCVSCGLCCTRIRHAQQNLDKMPPFEAEAMKKFPYATKEDGSCAKLGEDGKCTVYETRPLVCDMNRMYNKFYRPRGLSKTEWQNMNAAACNSMLEQANRTERVNFK